MCITEEKLVEAYGNSNPHERFLLIYKNYSVFPQLVDCYETGLFNRILGVVVTIKEMYGINRIDEFIKNCNLNGWLVNAIDIQNRIEIHEKINEEIRFD